jgi:MFS family permease
VVPGFLAGTLALQIRADLDVSVAAVAAGVTVFFLAGAFAAGPGGRLAERVGALTAVRAATLVTAACLLLIAGLAQTIEVFLGLLAVAGLANAVSQPAINLLLAEQVDIDHQGTAFGIKQSAIPGAILVSGLLLPAVALPLGWRPTLVICAAAVLAVTFAVGRVGRTLAPPVPRERPPRPSRALVFTAVGAALACAGPNALGTYLVASAVDIGIAEGTAGLLAALGSGTSLVVRVLAGRRADRRHDYGFGGVVFLLVVGSVGFVLLASDAAPAFVVGAVLAFSLGWGWPGIFNLAVVHSHRDSPGAATGVSQTGIYLGAAGGPALVGVLAQEIGYSATWAAMAALMLVSAGVMALAARSPHYARV